MAITSDGAVTNWGGISMKTNFLFGLGCALSALVFYTSPVAAQVSVVSQYSRSRAFSIDGQLKDWGGNQKYVVLSGKQIVGGKGEAWQDDSDLRAEFAFAHNDDELFMVLRVNDQNYVRTNQLSTSEDHCEVWFGLVKDKDGTLSPFGIGIYPYPDKQKVSVRVLGQGSTRAGAVLRGAKAAIVGLPSFYTVELSIPWSSLPLSAESGRRGLRAGVYIIDSDTSGKPNIETILGSAPDKGRASANELPILTQSDLDKNKNKSGKDKPSNSIDDVLFGGSKKKQ